MSSRRPSAPAPATASRPPTFPRYLLPSLRIPFTRRRTSEPALQTTGSSEPPSPTESSTESSTTSSTSAAPSLSTSPTSPTTPSSTRRLSRARPDTLRCRSCATDLAFHTQIVSKCFQGRHGRAYLVAPPPRVFPTLLRPGETIPTNTTTNTTSSRQHIPYTPAIPTTTTAIPAAAESLAGLEDELLSGPNLINVKLGPEEGRRLITGDHRVADARCAVCGATVGWKYVSAEQPAQAYKVGCFILETRRVVGCRGWEDEEGGDDTAGVQSGLALDGRPLGGGGNGDEGVIPLGWAADWKGEGEKGLEAVAFDSEDEDECEDMFAGVWDARAVAWRRKSKAARS